MGRSTTLATAAFGGIHLSTVQVIPGTGT
jgi:hypothetical protein